MNEAWGKVDAALAAGSESRQASSEGRRNPGASRDAAVPPSPSETKQSPVPPSATVAAAVVQPESAPAVNGGKRLTRQQRRALRRQAKDNRKNGGATAKVNGDNGGLLGLTAPEDPLAALARQRDLLR
jgi:hypothetical protein